MSTKSYRLSDHARYDRRGPRRKWPWVLLLAVFDRAIRPSPPPHKIVVSGLLVPLMLSATACAQLDSLTADTKPVFQTGSCWSQGVSFREVTDGAGNVHRVEPFQMRHLEGGDNIWFCGVSKESRATLANVPGKLEWNYFVGLWSIEDVDSTHSPGFHLPFGAHVYVNPLDLNQKFWILVPGEWIH